MLFKSRALTCLLLLSGISFAVSPTIKSAWDDSSRRTVSATRQPTVDVVETSQESVSWLTPTHKALHEDISRLELFRYSNNLDGLILTADELEKKWSQTGGEFYARFMLSVSNVISNGEFDDGRVKFLSQGYAQKALSKAEKFPLELEWQLLLFVQDDLNPADSEAWEKERSAKAKLWLHAWRRLEKEIDPNFDFKDRAFLNIMPPAETGLPSGVAPEAIKDPKLRAEYEAAIAANEEKSRRYDQQYNLRLTAERLPQQGEQYLIRVYAKPPYNPEELRTYLNEYLTDKAPRERIVNEVKKKIRQESGGVADPL